LVKLIDDLVVMDQRRQVALADRLRTQGFKNFGGEDEALLLIFVEKDVSEGDLQVAE
jgi:hypothetical protein